MIEEMIIKMEKKEDPTTMIEEMIIKMEKRENPTTITTMIEEITEIMKKLMTKITIETIEMRDLVMQKDIKKRERKTEKKEDLLCNGLQSRKLLLETSNSIL